MTWTTWNLLIPLHVTMCLQDTVQIISNQMEYNSAFRQCTDMRKDNFFSVYDSQNSRQETFSRAFSRPMGYLTLKSEARIPLSLTLNLLNGVGQGYNLTFFKFRTGYSGEDCRYESFLVRGFLESSFCGIKPKFYHISVNNNLVMKVFSSGQYSTHIHLFYQSIDIINFVEKHHGTLPILELKKNSLNHYANFITKYIKDILIPNIYSIIRGKYGCYIKYSISSFGKGYMELYEGPNYAIGRKLCLAKQRKSCRRRKSFSPVVSLIVAGVTDARRFRAILSFEPIYINMKQYQILN